MALIWVAMDARSARCRLLQVGGDFFKRLACAGAGGKPGNAAVPKVSMVSIVSLVSVGMAYLQVSQEHLETYIH